MNDRAIIDTSAWIKFFRKGKDNNQVADEVEHLLVEELIYYTEPVYIELVVGAGARSGIRELENQHCSPQPSRSPETPLRLT